MQQQQIHRNLIYEIDLINEKGPPLEGFQASNRNEQRQKKTLYTRNRLLL